MTLILPNTSSVVVSGLRQLLGQAKVWNDVPTLTAYAVDASIYRMQPQAVVLAEHEGDIDTVVRFAVERGIPLTPRAAGTNLTGSAIGSGIILDISKMNRQRDVERAFQQARMGVDVSGREKTLYSIYRKMREKHLSFAQVNDIFGFRIVAATLPECYMALGVLHQMYKPVPGRFKDYIAIPKANGYQSLHTTLVSPLGTAVEFQIRTEPMNAVAETGIAAHVSYSCCWLT